MTQSQLDRSVAARTGESARTVRRLGFQLQVDPADLPPVGLRLVVDCPACGRPTPYPGQVRGGSPAPAACPGHRCDISFAFNLGDVYVALA